MKLTDLRDNPGAAKRKKRVARGPGSGVGKTAGRGIKGQTSRSGVAIKGYEGGQMPIYMRLPKRGFNNIFRRAFQVINLSTLQQAVDDGRLAVGEPITEALLVARGVVRRKRDGIRLLGRGELSAPLRLELSGASETAKAAVEAAGGVFTIVAASTTSEA